MKKIGMIALIATVLFACTKKTEFTIKGKFEHVGTIKKVYLLGVKNNQMDAIDSTNVSESGEFQFVHKASYPDFYHISITDHQYFLIAENGDNITIKADLADKNLAYHVEGSIASEKLMKLNALKSRLVGKVKAIQSNFEQQLMASPNKRDSLVEKTEPIYGKAVEEMNLGLINFANENKGTLVGFYAINLIDKSTHGNDIVAFAEHIGSDLKQTPIVLDFLKKIEKLKNIQVGSNAPDFSIKSVDDKMIKLSDLKGKYVLLDFWASWCAPCRDENPNVVVAYNQFKAKNFTVFGISLDKEKSDWVQAIKTDKLTWTHASELNEFDGTVAKLYQVESIPSNFLIDPAGKIIAKNLRGTDLINFLTKTLK